MRYKYFEYECVCMHSYLYIKKNIYIHTRMLNLYIDLITWLVYLKYCIQRYTHTHNEDLNESL